MRDWAITIFTIVGIWCFFDGAWNADPWKLGGGFLAVITALALEEWARRSKNVG